MKIMRAACFFGAMVVSLAGIVAAQTAQTQTQFKVLYSFKGGTDGVAPFAPLVRDAAGSLYGATEGGGDLGCGGGTGCGTVFKLDSTGAETLLYAFTGGSTDGEYPFGGLVLDSAGNLYGTTSTGGTVCRSLSCGTVFEVGPSGGETVLYRFTGRLDGGGPQAALIRDRAGNLYGTTVYGGLSGFGTVFRVNNTGAEKVLYLFTGGTDGGYPYASLLRDAAGNLYGTAAQGGNLSCNPPHGCGTVFKVDSSGHETVLSSFAGSPDGQYPYGSVVQDEAGNFYGTTLYGGTSGTGTVFEVDTTGKETVLYSFTGGTDGGYPYSGLLRDAAGNLYGTASNGGDLSCDAPYGCGVVFKINSAGHETVLYTFTGGADGAFPYAALIRDSAGNLYGTADSGGDLTCNPPYGCGTVFELTH